MKISELMRYVLGISAAIVLTACGGGSQPSLLSGPIQESPAESELSMPALGHHPNLSVGAFVNAVQPHRRQSWMLPEAKKDTLLYISDYGSGNIYVYAHPFSPKSVTLVGTIKESGEPAGECVDKAGNVWVANLASGEGRITEYAHGGTRPIKILQDTGYRPLSCSVDPTTGNLAVTNFSANSGGQGNVLIYAHAVGTPKSYEPPSMYFAYFSAYDDAGNLYVDGENQYGYFEFAELPNGSSTFENILLSPIISIPGGVQWDGKNVAVGNQDSLNSTIYLMRFSGSKATLKGTVILDNGEDVAGFWIQKLAKGMDVVAPAQGNTAGSRVFFYNYPAGGSPKQTLTGFKTAIGAAVSTVRTGNM